MLLLPENTNVPLYESSIFKLIMKQVVIGEENVVYFNDLFRNTGLNRMFKISTVISCQFHEERLLNADSYKQATSMYNGD